MADFDDMLAPHEVRRIAADAFVFGFPLVLVDLVRRAHPIEPNQVLHLPDDAADVAPGLCDGDPRMVQSTAWIDLAGGPMIISLPPVDGRHLTVTFINAWGERTPSFDAAGAAPNGQELAIIGPEWRGRPSGDLPVLRAGTDATWMVTRLVAKTMGDREAARGLLAQQSIRAEQTASRTALAQLVLEPPAKASLDAIASLAPEIFFHRLAILLGRHPHVWLREDLEACAQMGVVPGKPYAPPSSDSQAHQAAVRGLADGLARIKQAAKFARQPASWRPLYPAPQHQDCLGRAVAALSGLGAAAAESILHLICETDSEGRPLSGAERYECRFPAGQAPPAESSWSISLHRRPPHGELLLHRYALGDHDRPTTEPNGDLRLLIQHAPPSSGQVANWLPSPLGEFALVLRLHGPAKAALNGSWAPPPLRRIEETSRTPLASGG